MRPWIYQPATDLGLPMVERLRCTPREPSLRIWALQLVAALLLRAWLRIYHRLRIDGRAHLPRGESFVMIANHASHLDALCLLAALPLCRLGHAFAAAAEDHFFATPLRAGLCAGLANGFPFRREGSPRASLQVCADLLTMHRAIVILFPEGTRSSTGAISRFRPGVGHLALKTGVPIVPCHVAGTHAALPRGQRWPRPHRIRLIIGAPVRFRAGSPQRIADELQRRILALAGSEEETRP